MDMTEIKGDSINLRLDPADAFLLARACSAAAIDSEGSQPKADHFAGLCIPPYALTALYSSLAAMFDAAGCCGFAQDEVPYGHHEEIALSVIRNKVRAAAHPQAAMPKDNAGGCEMIIHKFGEGTPTISLDGFECEQMARMCSLAAQVSAQRTTAGFSLSAAMVCRTHGIINLPAEVQNDLDAIRKRVQREEK